MSGPSAENQGLECQLVLSTAPDPEIAGAIARSLVQDRLAACVQCLPGATSVYTWQGQVEEATETLLLIKTTADRLEAVTRCIETAHPYELPEIIAVPVSGGHAPYLDWLRAATRPAEPGTPEKTT